MYNRKISAIVVRVLIIIIILTGVLVHPVDSSAITRNKGFSPSVTETEYTNKTMHFEVADPYDGYDTWTFEYLGGVSGPSDGKYYMDTDTVSYTQYFGYDEFSSQNDILAHVVFRSTLLVGIYRFQVLHYVYQKTSLDSSTHTAVSLIWYSGGLRLDWNTGNGDAPTLEPLIATAPIVNHEYSILLANSGNDTWVRVYDYTDSAVVYNGTTTTFNYDATVLYAAFGQYSGGSGAMYGIWENFTIVDSTLTYETIDPVVLWGLDVGLIIMGLIMIPASTMYFVRGGKEDMSRDKVFYFLIAFIIGWALVVGGITP